MRALACVAVVALAAAPAVAGSASEEALRRLAHGNEQQASGLTMGRPVSEGPLAVVVMRATVEADWLFHVAADGVIALDPDEPDAAASLSTILDEFAPPTVVAIGRTAGEGDRLLADLRSRCDALRTAEAVGVVQTATATLPAGSIRLDWADTPPTTWAPSTTPALPAITPEPDAVATPVPSVTSTETPKPLALAATATTTPVAVTATLGRSRWPWWLGASAIVSAIGGGAYFASRRTAASELLPSERAESPDDERLRSAVEQLREKLRTWQTTLLTR